MQPWSSIVANGVWHSHTPTEDSTLKSARWRVGARGGLRWLTMPSSIAAMTFPVQFQCAPGLGNLFFIFIFFCLCDCSLFIRMWCSFFLYYAKIIIFIRVILWVLSNIKITQSKSLHIATVAKQGTFFRL